MQKLVIWDFDGVIADTEKLWVQSRVELLKEYLGIDFTFEKAMSLIGGMSDKDKDIVLKKLGINVNNNFWKDALLRDKDKAKNGFALTEYIENIFSNKKIKQYIATGGILEKTKNKMKIVNIEKYFPYESVFTSDMVIKGKPEPDIFLLAAKKMGFKPEDCIVIEDSVAGLTAAQRAGMIPVAFVKYSKKYFLEDIKKLGIKNIFEDMRDVENFILNII
ncbi:MAG: HAD family phosphatase [Alphaproteobacteria bacterium]|nr:HAD family phosphatase [Alphaproteobacteria bacterium]